eukprot:GHVU01083417.1.p2 GENE.GHVU01083417.1~~GHVU01083417.1.p2  ORF type:complete len:130 (+),score=16.03 GHVU01083417.1:276-665(+)
MRAHTYRHPLQWRRKYEDNNELNITPTITSQLVPADMEETGACIGFRCHNHHSGANAILARLSAAREAAGVSNSEAARRGSIMQGKGSASFPFIYSTRFLSINRFIPTHGRKAGRSEGRRHGDTGGKKA